MRISIYKNLKKGDLNELKHVNLVKRFLSKRSPKEGRRENPEEHRLRKLTKNIKKSF